MSKKKILILAAVLLIAIIGQGLLAHRLRGPPPPHRLAAGRRVWRGAMGAVTQTRCRRKPEGAGAKGSPPPFTPARRRQTRLARQLWAQ